jgi:hypothetical protein
MIEITYTNTRMRVPMSMQKAEKVLLGFSSSKRISSLQLLYLQQVLEHT